MPGETPPPPETIGIVITTSGTCSCCGPLICRFCGDADTICVTMSGGVGTYGSLFNGSHTVARYTYDGHYSPGDSVEYRWESAAAPALRARFRLLTRPINPIVGRFCEVFFYEVQVVSGSDGSPSLLCTYTWTLGTNVDNCNIFGMLSAVGFGCTSDITVAVSATCEGGTEDGEEGEGDSMMFGARAAPEPPACSLRGERMPLEEVRERGLCNGCDWHYSACSYALLGAIDPSKPYPFNGCVGCKKAVR